MKIPKSIMKEAEAVAREMIANGKETMPLPLTGGQGENTQMMMVGNKAHLVLGATPFEIDGQTFYVGMQKLG